MTNEEDLDDLPDYLDLKKTLPPEEYAARLKQARDATERHNKAVPVMPKTAEQSAPQVAQKALKKEKSRVRVEQLLAKKTGETSKPPLTGRDALAFINKADTKDKTMTTIETVKPTTKKAPPKPTKKATAPVKAKAKAKAKTTLEPKAKAERGIGDIAKEAIMKGLDNDTVLAAVRKVFPGRSNLACVAWYRMDLKRKGNNVPPLAGTPKALVAEAAKKAAKKTKKAN